MKEVELPLTTGKDVAWESKHNHVTTFRYAHTSVSASHFSPISSHSNLSINLTSPFDNASGNNTSDFESCLKDTRLPYAGPLPSWFCAKHGSSVCVTSGRGRGLGASLVPDSRLPHSIVSCSIRGCGYSGHNFMSRLYLGVLMFITSRTCLRQSYSTY